MNLVIIKWRSSKGAETYSVQISKSELFTSFEFDQTSLACTTFQVPDLYNSSKYFWRVKAENAAGDSEWPKKSWSFYTHSPCESTPTVAYGGKFIILCRLEASAG